MKIYIDVICLLNVSLDFILLMSVSIILKRNVSIKKIILGSLLGGMSILIIFFNINKIILLFIKIILGLLMVISTFGYKNIKYTLNNLFYLYINSTILGGGMYLIKDYGYYNYFILIIMSIIIISLYIREMNVFKDRYSNYVKVDIYINKQLYKLNGYIDTGNNLYDQYKKRPIILTNIDIKHELGDIIYVPYVSLNNESVVKCLKIDKLIINNHIYKDYLVGLSNNAFRIDGINCILHSKMKGIL